MISRANRGPLIVMGAGALVALVTGVSLLAGLNSSDAEAEPTTYGSGSVPPETRALVQQPQAPQTPRRVIGWCGQQPYDQSALTTVRELYQGTGLERVYNAGPTKWTHQISPLPDNLSTRPNPFGPGVIVSAWNAEQGQWSADFNRKGFAWLFMEDRIWPLSSESTNEFALTSDLWPEDVRVRSGFQPTSRGMSSLVNQIGMDGYDHERNSDGTMPVAWTPCPASAAQPAQAAAIESAPTPSLASVDVQQLEPVRPVGYVSRETLGAEWPLTVPDGVMSCEGSNRVGAVYFAASGLRYMVNGMAQGRGDAKDIREIWLDNPNMPGLKIDMGPLIDAGLALCT